MSLITIHNNNFGHVSYVPLTAQFHLVYTSFSFVVLIFTYIVVVISQYL